MTPNSSTVTIERRGGPHTGTVVIIVTGSSGYTTAHTLDVFDTVVAVAARSSLPPAEVLRSVFVDEPIITPLRAPRTWVKPYVALLPLPHELEVRVPAPPRRQAAKRRQDGWQTAASVRRHTALCLPVGGYSWSSPKAGAS